MFASRSDALLWIASALQFGQRVVVCDVAEEDGFELVHSRIGKLDGGVVQRDHGRWPLECVIVLVAEKGNKLFSHSVRWPFEVRIGFWIAFVFAREIGAELKGTNVVYSVVQKGHCLVDRHSDQPPSKEQTTWKNDVLRFRNAAECWRIFI